MNKQISIMHFMKAYFNKIWIAILLVVICASSAYVYSSFFITPMYTYGVRMYINNKANNSSDSVTNSELQAREKLVKTYAALIKTNRIAKKVCQRIDEYKNQPGYEFLLDANYTPKKIINKLVISSVDDTEVLSISIRSTDPEEARFIVLAISEYIPESVADAMGASSAKLVDEDDLPTEPSHPEIFKLTFIGAAVGILLSAALVFIQLLTDTVVRTETDLRESIDNVIILGAIPSMIHYGDTSSAQDSK